MAKHTTWAAERRLDYIDFRMMTSGYIRRADLMRTFGVSMPQASQDLNRFLALHPKSFTYDKTIKRYVRCDGYKTRRGLTRAVRLALAELQATKHPMSWM